jgi:hypothetical protein
MGDAAPGARRGRPSGPARRGLRAALLALALAAVPAGALAAPPPGLPADGLAIGVQDDRLGVDPPSTWPARIDRLAATGIRITRVDVLWNAIAPRRPAAPRDPNDPAYRWAALDGVVDGLSARGIAVIANLYRSPSWANGGRDPSWAPDARDFGDFMSALSRRYSGTFTDPAGALHGRIAFFEPWNEPNISYFLKPQWRVPSYGRAIPEAPVRYAAMLRAAYPAVKANQPAAWVIGVDGAPTNTDVPPDNSMGVVTFIRALRRLRPPMDAFSQHIYPALGPTESVAMPSYRRIPDLLRELDPLAPGAPLLLTETGYTTAASENHAAHVTEAEQAEYLTQAVDLVRGQPRVRLFMWFNLQDNPGWPGGFLREDGTPKPSWDVFLALPKLFPPGP